jgi:endonuclease/exonuclease/phosphatase family metal-dependent hydrolase
MRLATWNLNNRVGKVRFRPEAAQASAALGADLVVFTEYFPQEHHQRFSQALVELGWIHQLLSREPKEVANRTLIASRLPLERDPLALPDFDEQFPANTVAARVPGFGLRVLGLRVPAYGAEQQALLKKSWEWLENTAASLLGEPAVILGDLNVRGSPSQKDGEAHFRRILESGWKRAAPAGGSSYYGASGVRSEIDHVLFSTRCTARSAEYVTSAAGFTLAGAPSALSDHAALVVDIEIPSRR